MLHKNSILAIGDRLASLGLLTNLLRNEGYKVSSVNIESFRFSPSLQREYALVILDIDISDTYSLDMCRRFESNVYAKNIPIVVIAAASDMDALSEIFKSAAVDYINKPYKDRELIYRVNTYMKLSKLQFSLNVKNLNLQVLNEQLSQEIAEHKITEDALRFSMNEWQSTFDAMQDFIFILSKDFKVLKVNKSTCSTLSVKMEDMLGRYYFNILYKSDKPIDNCPAVRSLSSKLPENDEYEYEGKIYKLHALPILSAEANIKYIVYVVHDITEERRIHKKISVLHRLESIENMASGVAHYFNNMLAGILGAATMLFEEESLEEKKTLLETIIKSAENGALLTQKLLLLGNRNVKKVVKPVNINKSIRDVIDLYRHSILKPVKVYTDFVEDIYLTDADPSEVSQIISNLYMNAVEAVSNDGIISFKTSNFIPSKAFIEKYPQSLGKLYACFTISDNGCGIDETILKNIYEPFFSTKSDNNSNICGLGLSVVHRILKNNNNIIEVSSQPGVGTTFSIYLQKGEGIEAEDVRFIADITKGAGTILVVDDERMILSMVQSMLERLGYTVVTADNGMDAVNIFKRVYKDINAIILDIKMPGLNGKETFAKLKSIDPFLHVLISSGFNETADIKDMIKMGAKGFFPKPYNIRALGQVVASVIRQ